MPARRTTLLLCLAALAFGAGCGQRANPLAVRNTPPEVHFTAPAAPLAGASGAIHTASWIGTDRDGRIDHYLVAVNPASFERIDAGWTRTVERSLPVATHRVAPLAARGDMSPVGRREPVIVAVRAVDDRGAMSDAVGRAYFDDNVAPSVQITSPRPSRLIEPVLPPAFRIRWEGTDPDGRFTQRPVKYKFRLFDRSDPEFPVQLAIDHPDSLRNFYAPVFAGWDSLPGDTTEISFSNLVPDRRYLFVITAIDEAGDYDPLFSPDKNMLMFKVGFAGTLGPRISVFNQFFSYSYPNGGFCADPSCEVPVTAPADVPLTFNWFAEPLPDLTIDSYRWALDIADVNDETPRRHGRWDLNHWSPWSLDSRSATIGPFHAWDSQADHRLYIEARDDIGEVSLGIVHIRVIRTRFDSELLIVNDTRFLPDRVVSGQTRPPTGTWPTAAELDTFLFARGGVPWRDYPPGTMSQAGILAGYSFDTLGTRTGTADATVPLEVLGRYRHVLWIVDGAGARFDHSPLDPGSPMTALRWMSSPGRSNTLAQYVERGGHLWIAGGGAGCASTINFNSIVNDLRGVLVFSSVGSHPELVPGRFMYEIPHWQTEFRVRSLRPARVRHAPFPIGHRWSRLEYAQLPDELALRSPATDPMPPLRDPTSGFYNPISFLEYMCPPGGTLVDCGPLGRGGWPRAELDTLMVATGPGLPPEGPDPAQDRIVNPVMTAYGGCAAGSVVFSGFDLWSFSRHDCERLADAVLQGMWHLHRGPLPPPGPSEGIALERTIHSGGGRAP